MTNAVQVGARRLVPFLLAVVLLFSVCGFPVLAAETGGSGVPQASVDFYVYDEANVLSAETKSTLLKQCTELDTKYGVQIVVMTLETIPGSTADQRVAYAEQVIDAWNIGGADGNGLLLMLSISDADYWAVAAEGFKESFTNSVLSEMLKTRLEPDFANRAYDEGVKKFVQTAILNAETYMEAQTGETSGTTDGETSAQSPATGTAGEADKAQGGIGSVLKGIGIFLLVVLALVVVLFVVVYVRGQIVRKKRREARRRRMQQRSADTRRTADRRTGTRRDDSSDYRAFMDRYK